MCSRYYTQPKLSEMRSTRPLYRIVTQWQVNLIVESIIGEIKQEITRDPPATYRINMPGHLDICWVDWAVTMTITLESGYDGLPITILTGAVDHSALQGLLRRLYSLGLPLISVNYLEVK